MADLNRVPLEELLSSFDSYGYGLVIDETVSHSISAEEAIVAALIQKFPRLVEGVPVLLANNQIDYAGLRQMIDSGCLWNEFGYLGEFALTHFENQQLRETVEHCRQKLKPESSLYWQFHDFFKKFQKEEEKRWNLIGAPSYSSLEQQFRRYKPVRQKENLPRSGFEPELQE